MKRDKDSLYKGFKTYNMIMSCVWQLLTTLLIGVLAGYLLERKKDDDFNYMIVSICISLVVGISVFFVSLIKQSKRLAKEEENKKRYEESLLKEDNDEESR